MTNNNVFIYLFHKNVDTIDTILGKFDQFGSFPTWTNKAAI